MFKDSTKIMLQVILGVFLVSVLTQFLEVYVILIIGFALAIGIVLFNLTVKGNKEAILEIECKADEFIKFVDEKYEINSSKYVLLKAYALFYLNNIEESRQLWSTVDVNNLKKKKDKYIYHTLHLKYLYLEGNQDLYFEQLENLVHSDLLEFVGVVKEVFEIPLFILQEKYDVARELLMSTIPITRKRYLVFELEYYLAHVHIYNKDIDDAKAVLEFVASKDMKFLYIEKCKEMLKNM